MYTQTRESIRTLDDTFYEYIVRVVGNILKFHQHRYETRLCS